MERMKKSELYRKAQRVVITSGTLTTDEKLEVLATLIEDEKREKWKEYSKSEEEIYIKHEESDDPVDFRTQEWEGTYLG